MTYPTSFGPLSYNPENKQRFLNESAKLLRIVAQSFPDWVTKVTKNEGGMAVGGEAYLRIEKKDATHGVLVTITHSGFGGTRQDGVLCYLQHRLPDVRGKLNRLPVNIPNQESAISPAAITAAVRTMLAQTVL